MLANSRAMRDAQQYNLKMPTLRSLMNLNVLKYEPQLLNAFNLMSITELYQGIKF